MIGHYKDSLGADSFNVFYELKFKFVIFRLSIIIPYKKEKKRCNNIK